MDVSLTLTAKVTVTRMDVDFTANRVLLSGWIHYTLPDSDTIIHQDEFRDKKVSIEYAAELFESVNKEKMWDSLKGKTYDEFEDDIPF